MSTSKPTEGTLDAKLERMLANWEKPAVRSVMLPGTPMTCDEAAAAIRAALTGTVEPVQVKPDWLVNTTKRVGQRLADYDNNVSHDHEEGDPTDDNLSEFDRDDIRTLLAALAPVTLSNPKAPAAREVAWLIERKDASLFQQPHWYHEQADGWHSWRPNAHDAKRFASKAEAEAFPAYQMIASDPTILITEHVFIGSLPEAPAAPGEAWCQPMSSGEHTPRKFIVRFEDAEMSDAVFDDETEAREYWSRVNQNWNCYLFGALPLVATPPALTSVPSTFRS